MRVLTIIGIFVFAIAGVVIMGSLRPEPPKKERVELDPLVEVIVLETMTANFEVNSQGNVRPRTETILSAEVSGTITSISPKFVAGGVFQAGEVLMRVDPTNYEVALKQAEALFLIYALIAIPLRSYAQPLIIMSVIPFGAIGAVIGHIIMGRSISMFSLFGLIALAGVVVNDSLIMVDFINKARARGVAIRDAVIQSGTARFRAIILTSFTTAAGLLPIMFETSPQAQAIIPTAISIGYGIIFATIITLFLIPALYLLQEDFFRHTSQFKNWLLYRPAAAKTD